MIRRNPRKSVAKVSVSARPALHFPYNFSGGAGCIHGGHNHVAQNLFAHIRFSFLRLRNAAGPDHSSRRRSNNATWTPRRRTLLAAGRHSKVCDGTALGRRTRYAFPSGSSLLQLLAHAATETSASAGNSPAGPPENGGPRHRRSGKSPDRMPAATRHESWWRKRSRWSA